MYHLDLGFMEYNKALNFQRHLVNKRLVNELPDVLITVEHPHVYTIGKRGKLEDIPGTDIPVIKVERGGSATYHGPGQLVAYPIVNLIKMRLDVPQFVEMLENVCILTLKEYGIPAERMDKKPGVWVNGKKIASIGLAIKNWIAYHGVAININVNLNYFKMIKPCGFEPSLITSLNEILGRDISLEDVKRIFVKNFTEIFSVKIIKKSLEDLFVA